MILPSGGRLRDQGEHTRDDPVSMRRRIEAIMAQHDLNALSRLRDYQTMAAVRRGKQRRQRRRQRRSGEEIQQDKTTHADLTQGQPTTRTGLLVTVHVQPSLIQR